MLFQMVWVWDQKTHKVFPLPFPPLPLQREVVATKSSSSVSPAPKSNQRAENVPRRGSGISGENENP